MRTTQVLPINAATETQQTTSNAHFAIMTGSLAVATGTLAVISGTVFTDDAASALGKTGLRVGGQYSSDESADTLDAGDGGTIALNQRRGVRVDLQTLISGEDQVRDLLAVIGTVHREQHAGTHFYCPLTASAVDAGNHNAKLWTFFAPNSSTRVHFAMDLTCSGSGGAWWYLYESPSIVTTIGNEVSSSTQVFNNERNSVTTASVMIRSDPTIDASGSLIWAGVVPAGGGHISFANGDPDRGEFVLLQSGTYCIKFRPDRDDTDCCALLKWYEE